MPPLQFDSVEYVVDLTKFLLRNASFTLRKVKTFTTYIESILPFVLLTRMRTFLPYLMKYVVDLTKFLLRNPSFFAKSKNFYNLRRKHFTVRPSDKNEHQRNHWWTIIRCFCRKEYLRGLPSKIRKFERFPGIFCPCFLFCFHNATVTRETHLQSCQTFW